MNYKIELDLIKNITKSIYEMSKEEIRETSLKGEQDIVTSTDLFIEKALIKAIKNEFPNDKFHTEEFNSETLLENRTWIIDPIDGTSNYAADLGLFVIQIALYDQGDIVLSYIYAPVLNKTYYAIKGFGTYLNDKRYYIKDKITSNFMISMVGITHNNEDKRYYKKLLDLGIEHKYKMRMLGSIGLELVLASEGVFDLFYTNVTNLWDLCPGVLCLRESGAILVNELGEEYQITHKNLFVCKDEVAFNVLKTIL